MLKKRNEATVECVNVLNIQFKGLVTTLDHAEPWMAVLGQSCLIVNSLYRQQPIYLSLLLNRPNPVSQ